jgi:hypothetical protein
MYNMKQQAALYELFYMSMTDDSAEAGQMRGPDFRPSRRTTLTGRFVYLRIGKMDVPRGGSIARRFEAPTALREAGVIRHLGRRWYPGTRNGRVAPAATSSLVWLRAGGYSERRKATRSDFSCLVKPMLNRVL